jgi:hypothetical protein
MTLPTLLTAQVLLGLSLAGTTVAVGATSYNVTSPMGMNLAPINYWSTEQPFINIYKSSGVLDTMVESSFNSTGEEKYLDLDKDGWPRSLKSVHNDAPQRFTQLRIILRPQLAPSINGASSTVRFIVRYKGQGTVVYGDSAKQDQHLSSPGRDVLDVTRNQSGGQFFLVIKDTDPHHTGDYIRDIQVYRADQEHAVQAGELFNPRFLELIRDFRVFRFMEWLRTNASAQSKWNDRPTITNAVWSSTAGVPYEVILQLSNKLSADPWLTIPAMADDDYIAQLARLIHTNLGATQKVYVELSNETWNGSFEQSRWMTAQGKIAFPNLSDRLQNRNWYGMRTAQMCDIWKAEWHADFSRVVCVLAAQASYLATAIDALNCSAWTAGTPCSKHNIGAVAIAPYFGDSAPQVSTSDGDGGLSKLFALLAPPGDTTVYADGSIHQALDWIGAYSKALNKYGLPLIAYEGGQSLVSFPHGKNTDNSDNALTNLYIAANRDPRMEAAYRTYLEGWRSSGGQLFVHFNDIGAYSQYGEFSALESISQTTEPLSSAPPKWRAIEKFISANPCWWASCQGQIAGNQR